MNVPRKRIRETEELRKALEEVGGEALSGSGFEHETPEEGFTEDKRRAVLDDVQ